MTEDAGIVKQLRELRDHHAREFERIDAALRALTKDAATTATPPKPRMTKATAKTAAKKRDGATRYALAKAQRRVNGRPVDHVRRLLSTVGVGGTITRDQLRAEAARVPVSARGVGVSLTALARSGEINLTKDGILVRSLKADPNGSGGAAVSE